MNAGEVLGLNSAANSHARRKSAVPMITILIDGEPRFVVRPNDNKALHRFLRSTNKFLVGDKPGAAVSHRPSEDAEFARWKAAYNLQEHPPLLPIPTARLGRPLRP